MRGRHLLSIGDLTADEVRLVLRTAQQLKSDLRAGVAKQPLAGKTLAMLFQKPSLRTRVSFEVGMQQLGGRALYLSPAEVQMGERESIGDVARVLSRYVDVVMARVFRHSDLVEFANYSSVPVINGLSDLSHPCQALADFLTILEKKGRLEGLTLAYIGDGDNNVAHSLLLGAAKLGVNFHVASPQGYAPSESYRGLAQAAAQQSGSVIKLFADPSEAVTGADVIYTDVWTSMGQEDEAEVRRRVFRGYQVDAKLVRMAKGDAIVMHDLPAHRGEEITDDVMDGPQSVVFDQAENRMHAQKAVLYLVLGAGEA